jgi:multidrug efflux system membrane fusion protein
MFKKIKLDQKLKIIIIMISLIAIWMISGIFTTKTQSEIANISTESKLKLMDTEADIRTQYLSFSAIATASNSVNLIPQVTGQVTKVFVKDGDVLKTGDNIIQLTNESLIKRVTQMESAVGSARLQYNSAKELFRRNLGSEIDIDNAATALKGAESDLAKAKNDLDNTIIIAPFDGIIDAINVQEGDIISNTGAGYNNVGRFLDLSSIQAKAYLSQSERNQILENQGAIIIRDNNSSISAKVTFIAQSADENTGTFLVKAVGENKIKIVDGEAVVLKIKIGEIKSHKIPISALIIDGEGDLSVNIIDNNDQLMQSKITLVDEDDTNIWIAGIPDKCKIVLASQ